VSRLPVTLVFVKKGGELVLAGKLDEVKYDTFVKSVNEGDRIEVTYEVQVEDGSYSQISKLHACIREVAKSTGSSFEDMKKEVKRRAGLTTIKGGEEDYRSFGDCSKEELSLAIQAVIEIGDFVGCNLR